MSRNIYYLVDSVGIKVNLPYTDMMLKYLNMRYLDVGNVFTSKYHNSVLLDKKNDNIQHIKVKNLWHLIKILTKEKPIIILGVSERWYDWYIYFLLQIFNIPTISIQSRTSIIGSRSFKDSAINTKVVKKKNYIGRILFFIYISLVRLNIFKKSDLLFLVKSKMKDEKLKFNRYKEVVDINTIVYDEFLRDKIVASDDYIVFLDHNVPNHPEHKRDGYETMNEDDYYKNLNNFFDKIEKVTKKEVVICAHPNYDLSKKEKHFRNRKVYKYRVMEFIAKAKLVLFHYTNAIQYAVLYRKPLLILGSKELGSFYEYEIKFNKETLGLESIDFTKFDEKELESILDKLNVNEELYSTFIKNYIAPIGEVENSTFKLISDMLNERYG